MIEIATVVRLQVQSARLKPGPALTRRYDPSPLRVVDALEVGPRGVVGLRGQDRLLDVHHADHPDTRNNKLRNGLSLLPRIHYDRLRAGYGPHLVDGSAGESVLVETAGFWDAHTFCRRVLLEVDGGQLELADVMAAPPCVEFSRYALGREPGDTGPEVLAALADLDEGARGFYASARGEGVVRLGARLWGDG